MWIPPSGLLAAPWHQKSIIEPPPNNKLRICTGPCCGRARGAPLSLEPPKCLLLTTWGAQRHKESSARVFHKVGSAEVERWLRTSDSRAAHRKWPAPRARSPDQPAVHGGGRIEHDCHNTPKEIRIPKLQKWNRAWRRWRCNEQIPKIAKDRAESGLGAGVQSPTYDKSLASNRAPPPTTARNGRRSPEFQK